MSEEQITPYLVDHLPKIRSLIYRISRDQGVVDDITQECCARIIEKEKLYKGDYSPGEMTLFAMALGRKCYDSCWAPDYAEVRQWLEANDIRTFIPNFPQATSALYRSDFERHIMRDKGDLQVIPWTPNLEKDWAEYERWDFDGILTDRPSGFLEWAGR